MHCHNSSSELWKAWRLRWENPHRQDGGLKKSMTLRAWRKILKSKAFFPNWRFENVFWKSGGIDSWPALGSFFFYDDCEKTSCFFLLGWPVTWVRVVRFLALTVIVCQLKLKKKNMDLFALCYTVRILIADRGILKINNKCANIFHKNWVSFGLGSARNCQQYEMINNPGSDES